MTDFSKLPKRVKRVRSRRLKGCSCGETTKEQLAPGVTRIHGNLCNVHGKYGPCDAALSKKPKGSKKPKKGRAEAKPKAPKKDPVKNRAATLSGLGYSAADQEALSALRDGKQPAGVGQQLIDQGLVERAGDGSYRLTASGRAMLGAADQGDAGRVRDTVSSASDRTAARGQRQAAAQQRRQDLAGKRAAAQMDRQLRQQERDAKRAAAAAKKPSGGGGGDKQPETPQSKRQARLSVRRGRAPTGATGASSSSTPAKKPVPPKPKNPEKVEPQIAPALQQAAQALSEGADVNDEDIQKLIANGLVKLNKDGEPVLTAAGQRVTKKEAGNPGDYLVVEDREKPSTWHLQVKRNGKPDHGLMGGAWAALHGGYRGNKYEGPQKGEALSKLRALYVSEKMPIPSEKEVSFTVYKDASGVDRWLSVSSTAYRDRDKEIVSTKALQGAVALADASGYRGPLRFWHVPGVELGNCDYQATAQAGRFLIESGTFRSPAIAVAVKSHADNYQMSIGFTHPPNEPDSNGVFTNIAIFERSLVPNGRASNPLTQFALVTKETRMLTSEKQAELTKLLDGNTELLSGLLGQVAQTDKAAQDQGVAYKDAPDIRAIIREELSSLLGQTTEKAAPPVEEPSVDAEAKDDGMGDMEAMADDAAVEENMLTDAECSHIADMVAAKISPLLNIESKMSGYLNEMKGLMGGMSAQKDAALAEVKTELAAVKAQVDDLSGSQPRILAGGYRASQSTTTITTDETKLKDAQPAADPVASAFGAFMTDLFGNPPGQVAPGA